MTFGEMTAFTETAKNLQHNPGTTCDTILSKMRSVVLKEFRMS